VIHIPERLFASDRKMEILEDSICGSCILFRRTEIDKGCVLFNEEGLMKAAIINSIDMYNTSVNVAICNEYEYSGEIESKNEDVNLKIKDVKLNIDFQSEELTSYPSEHPNIDAYCLNKEVVSIQISDVNSCKGKYRINRSKTEYDYKLKVVFSPNLYNIFHCIIQVLSNEETDSDEDFKPLDRSKKPNHRRTLASKLRNYFIENHYFKEINT
jgi:hypothetical protein